ncbi:MAG: hypothetical protein ACLFM0_07895 [Spirochaetales bacterium]
MTSLRLGRILHELIMYVQFRVIRLTLLFLIGILCIEANAQEQEADDSPAQLERESPASLIETEIGDADTDLFLSGSWRSRLGFDLGLIRPREGAGLPGLADGRFSSRPFPEFTTQAFENIVDLTLSVRVDDRYFFETSFVDDFELDTLLFGYDGREEDTLKELLVGQGPISIPAYPFLPVAESAGNALGASARIESQRSRHDLMARFEPTTIGISRFQGQRELSQTRIDPATWVRNRRFILPDERVTGLRVFREVGTRARDGDIDPGERYDRPLFTDAAGHIYEEIDVDAESTYSLARGTLTLDTPAEGRIVAAYSVENARVGDAGLGTDFLPAVQADGRLDPDARLDANREQFDEAIDEGNSGSDAGEYLERIGRERALRTDLGDPDESEDLAEAASLFFDISDPDTGEKLPVVLLYEPGYYSPFARADSYDAGELPDEDSSVSVEYLRPGSRAGAELPVRPPARSDADSELLLLGGPEVRSTEARHPFGTSSPLYGPGARRRGEEASFEIVVEEAGPREEISLPENVIPGTVSLTRNGVSESRFSVGSGGSVDLGFEPGESDELEFRYRTFDRGAEANELVFASGNSFAFGQRNELTLALGGRWDAFSEQEFTETPGEKDGVMTLSSEYAHESERLSAHIRGAGLLSVADTTGARRVFGMEGNSVPIDLPGFRLLPGRVPEPFEFRSAEGVEEETTDPVELDASDRGRLLYRDYRVNGTLRSIETDLDDDQIYPYESGSLVGPYPAIRPDDGDRAVVFDYDLSDGQWVSGQIQIPPENLPRESEGVRLRWEAIETMNDEFDGSVDVYLQFGAVGEDLDSDGILDSGLSTNRPTFPFFDASDEAGFDLRAGGVATPGGRAASEDGTQTGTLASEDPERIASRKIAEGVDSSSEGKTTAIRFTQAERRRIQEGRAVRLVIVDSDENDGSGGARGRLLVSDVSVLGSPLLARPVRAEDGSGSNFVRAEGPSVRAGEISERDARDASGEELQTPLGKAFPESVRFGTDEENRVLEVDYENLDDNGDADNALIELRGNATGVRLNEYRNFAGYIHTGSAGSLKADLLYVNSEDTGIVAEGLRIPESDEWQKLDVSTDDGSITLDNENGEQVLDTTAEIDRMREVRTLILRVRPGEDEVGAPPDARTEGTWYLDELHFSGSSPNLDTVLEAGARYVHEGTVFSPERGPSISDFELGAQSRVEADVSGNSVSEVSGRTDSAVTIGGIRLDGEFGAVFSPAFDELLLSAGHGLRGPLTADNLRIEDRYSREFGTPGGDRESRSTSLELQLDTVSADIESRGSTARDRLRQSWSLQSGWDPPRIALSVGVSQVNRGYSPPDTGYFESWIRSYSLLTPIEPDDALERRVDASIERSTGSHTISPTGTISATSESFVDTLEQRSSLDARLGVRFAPEAEETSTSEQQTMFRDLTVEPYYRRALRVSDSFSGGSYREDLSRYSSAIAEESYLYTSPPVLELFERRDNSAFQALDSERRRAEYRPALGLQADRSFGSRLRDLIVPYRLEGEFGRTYERREDSLRETRDITASASTFAVNLFGRLGAYSLTDLYSSDEFFSRISSSILLTRQHEVQTALENEFRFLGEDGAGLELTNEYTVRRNNAAQRANDSAAVYTWISDASFAESIQWPVEYERARVVHEEQAQLELNRSNDSPATERTRVTAEHRSRLELDNVLRIEASLRLGWQQESEREEPAVDSFGIRGIIEATLRF